MTDRKSQYRSQPQDTWDSDSSESPALQFHIIWHKLNICITKFNFKSRNLRMTKCLPIHIQTIHRGKKPIASRWTVGAANLLIRLTKNPYIAHPAVQGRVLGRRSASWWWTWWAKTLQILEREMPDDSRAWR